MTADAIAKQIINEAQRRGYDPVPPLATAIQESSLRPGVVSPNGKWIGIYQQDTSYSDRSNPTANITQFFDRLDAKRKTAGWSQDLWLNIFWLQQRPGEPSADAAFRNGRQAYLTEIKSRKPEAQRYVALHGGTMPAIDYGVTKVMHGFNPTTPANATGNSNGPRKSTLYAVIHTQEGDGTATSLANYLNSNKVSYNIVVDAVDTVEVVPVDQGPWAAMEANNIAFHLCFAGSRAGWNRATWLSKDAMLRRGAKAVAAACKQFDIPAVKVLATNGWPVTPKGIAAHADFGKRGGGHTDPGPEFPWPEFIAMVQGYLGTAPTTPEVPVPDTKPLTAAEDNQIQLRGPGLKGWPQLGGRTLVDAVAAIGAKLGIDGFKDVR